MTDMSISFAGVRLKNPLIAASGCFGFGREYGEYFDISRLGGISVKGLTLKPRHGNKPPRIAETPCGCLNSVGLQNPGVEAFMTDELPFLRTKDVVVIANISGDTAQEYGDIAGILGDAPDMLEVNISCPNVKAGGLAFGADPAQAALVTELVKKNASVPVCVKLSPNVTDIAAVARACEQAGADALSLINTLLGMRIDIETGRPILPREIGGLSGPAVFPVAVGCVWRVKQAVKIPICGMGGVTSGRDLIEMIMAGACTVGMGTALLADPYAPLKALHQAHEWCQGRGVEKITDIVN
ncbi:MAG: dihydroorotate dehydrogenase [Oscillospiraceae bacterium]|nr:dihydroorotate dehydrogenase [Oscillospiraceae bacterium]